jgi:hypothetical protein
MKNSFIFLVDVVHYLLNVEYVSIEMSYLIIVNFSLHAHKYCIHLVDGTNFHSNISACKTSIAELSQKFEKTIDSLRNRHGISSN